MQRQKTIAMMVALIMGTTATAYALNVGVINATRPKPAAASTALVEQQVTTIIVDVPYDTGPAPVEAAAPVVAVEAETAAAPVARVVTPAAAPAPTPTPAPTLEPQPESVPVVVQQAVPTTQPEAVIPSVTYETFTAGPAGQVVLAHTGNTIEFWAAYTANGWNYQVVSAKGQEVIVKYRLGDSEMTFIAKVKGGQVVTAVEGPSGGGEEDD